MTGHRLGKNIFPETVIRVVNYNSQLDTLMQEFRDRVHFDVHGGVHQVLENLSLDALTYAKGVGLNKEKKCLDGTRTELLNEIVEWISNTATTATPIF